MKTNKDLKIDLVYTWVDGNDADWQERKSKYTNNSIEYASNQKYRFKDNEELRFSLRSVEKFAPWINHIFIITDNQIPKWLDTDNPKITIIDHKDIIPLEALPTYNSCSIEHCMANIPNLSEYFLYANDDTFLGDYVTPDFFFDKNGNPIYRVKHINIKTPKRQHITTIFNSYNLIKSHGYNCKLYNKHHNIDPYRKSIIQECYKEFQSEIDKTINNRFRDSNDIQRIIYTFYAAATNRGVLKLVGKYDKSLPWYKYLYNLITKKYGQDSMFFNNKSKNIKSKIEKFKPKLFCINDTMNGDVSDKNLIKKILITFFPDKSLFEKYNVSDNFISEQEPPKDYSLIMSQWATSNYGNILSCYGLQSLLEELGKNVKILNYIDDSFYNKKQTYKDSYAKVFAQRYLNLTQSIHVSADLYELNKNSETFITLYDNQIFKNDCCNLNRAICFLDFVRANKKKISYSMSFKNSNSYLPVDLEKIGYYLSLFDDISVKNIEDNRFLKENFDLNSVQVIDSVFHIPNSFLESVTQNYKSDEKYIGIYRQHNSRSSVGNEFIKEISSKLNMPVREFIFDYKIPVDKWLAFIKNASLIMTDSYYGTLFSIIFNIPFVLLRNDLKIKNITQMLNIENRFYLSDGNICYEELLKPFDWDSINEKIKQEKEKSAQWLKEALDKKNIEKTTMANFTQEDYTKLLIDRNKLYRKYVKCKLLSKITFGDSKKYYKEMKKELKIKVKKVRELMRT